MQNHLIHGDSVKALEAIPSESVDFILTDPPYVSRYKDFKGRVIPTLDPHFHFLQPLMKQLNRVLKPNAYMISFYGYRTIRQFTDAWTSNGFDTIGHFSTVKNYSSGISYTNRQHEAAYLLAKGNPTRPSRPLPDVLQWGEHTKNVHHPSQKPLPLMEQFIEAYTKPDDVILDPFAGSGTTPLAAARTGRRFIGVELDQTYYNAARERLEAEAIPFETNLNQQGVTTMANDINQITLVGNLGEDADIFMTKEGKKIAKFRLATNESFTSKDGKKIDRTEWHTCVSFDEEYARVLEEYGKKGKRLMVTGRIQTRVVETDGEKKYFTEIVTNGPIALL